MAAEFLTEYIVNRDFLRDLIQERCLEFGDFTLSTGQKSKFYFDCKKATLDGQTLTGIADAFLERLQSLGVTATAIGGLTMGADSISAAVAMRASQIGARTVHASIVRKEPKKHGTMNFIENQQPPGTQIVVVDDVITTGKSTEIACEKFKAAGYEIVAILALVDREESNGSANLAAKYLCPVASIFKKSDFPKMAESGRSYEADFRQKVAGGSR
jgi:orotate phosphoribosyltransferase